MENFGLMLLGSQWAEAEESKKQTERHTQSTAACIHVWKNERGHAVIVFKGKQCYME